MKKSLKHFAATLFVGASLFAGINGFNKSEQTVQQETYSIQNTNREINNFDVYSFNFINNSITDEGFEFLIDVRLTNGNPFIPFANNLILYSNGMPLNTEFEGYQGSFLKYKVSGLQPNSIYTNFSVGIVGYSDIESLGSFAISTKDEEKNEAGVIVGSTIGGLIFVALIVLLVIFLVRFINKDEENEEYSVHNEYVSFEDANGNRVEMTKEEFEKQFPNTNENYQKIEEESEYLSSPNNEYKFIPNENSYEEDPGFH